MNKINSGVTMLEFLFALSIAVIIAVPLFMSLRTSLQNWKIGSQALHSSTQLHHDLQFPIEKIRSARRLQDISLRANTKGYIRFTDAHQDDYVLCYNSNANQNLFNASNSFAINSLIFFKLTPSPSPERLLANVSAFGIESYVASTAISEFAVSVNNITEPNYAAINSLKLLITHGEGSSAISIEPLIHLYKSPVEDTGSYQLGHGDFPFENVASSVANLRFIANDDPTHGDILTLEPADTLITIAGTGQFFSSIELALAAAVSGNTILVAHTPSGYETSFTLPAGIRIQGGYNSATWERNINAYPTVLRLATGKPHIIDLQSNTHIDGLVLDSQNTGTGIVATNATDISISNTQINNAQTGIALTNTNGRIVQTRVTANLQSLHASQSTALQVHRNIFTTLQTSHSVLDIDQSSNLSLANNLIFGGHTGIKLQNIQNATLAHNTISAPQNFGCHFTDLTQTTFFNSVIAQTPTGIFYDDSVPGDFSVDHINGNFLANTPAPFTHSSDPALELNISNTIVTHSNFQWEFTNPYFDTITSFIPKSNSILIDAGIASPEPYHDDNPSQGTNLADIGSYGGSLAGRVGPAHTHEITPAMSSATFYAAIASSQVGDHFNLLPGSYDLTQSIVLKPEQFFAGTPGTETSLTHIGSTALIDLHSDSTVTQLYIHANSKTAFSAANLTGITLTRLIIDNAQIGVLASNSQLDVHALSFYNSDTGIQAKLNSTISSRLTIFDTLNLALETDGSSNVSSHFNVFHNVDTLSSGGITQLNSQTLSNSPFRSPNTQRYELIPTSSAINISANHDAGALAYYLHSGHYTTSIPSTLARHYKTLRITHATTPSPILSELAITFSQNNTHATLNPTLLLTQSPPESPKDIALPNSILGKDLALTLTFNAYTPNSAVVLDDVILTW